MLDLAGDKARVRALRAPFPDQRFDIQGLVADAEAVASGRRPRPAAARCEGRRRAPLYSRTA